MEFPFSKIAAVAPYTPPRPISFLVLLAFFDKLCLPLCRKAFLLYRKLLKNRTAGAELRKSEKWIGSERCHWPH